MPGYRGISHDHYLEGLDAFPGYQFIMSPVHIDGWEVIEEGTPFSWYKLHGTHIYAVPSSVELPEEQELEWLEAYPRSMEFFRSSSEPITSGISARKTTYKVTGITGDEVQLELVEDEVIRVDAAPLPESAKVALPLISGAALCGLFLLRRRRKSRA